MAQQGFLNKVREWIGSVAFAILLWSLEMTEDEFYDEQIRVAEQRDAPIHAEQKCPSCENGVVYDAKFDKWFNCDNCNGTGISNRSAGG